MMPSVNVALRQAVVEHQISPAIGARRVEIARVEIFHDFASAAPAWDRLTARGASATPFGRRDWIEAWHRHVGAPRGLRPLICVARDDHGEPLFLLPLAYRPGRMFTVARCFGGAHSQLNMGVWRRDVAGAVTAQDIHAIFATVAEQHGIDLFLMLNQPAWWDGRRNPLAQLPHQASPDEVFSVDFGGESGEQVYKTRLKPALRGVLKSKEKKLAKLDGYRYFRAATAAEAERLLAAFLAQKAGHFQAQGVPNVFAEPGVAAFLRAACLDGIASGRPAVELHAIEGGGEVLAVMGGTAGPQRFSAMFNSYTLTEHARWSPGLILIAHMVRHCADRGLESYDLGAGYAAYKRFFCKTVDPLFDSFLAFSERGHAAAAAYRCGFAAKRWIKASRPLWAIVRTVRRISPG
jgi:CelD/BcsL family acetyltransferase involved in cellulose biosynthesis